MSTDNPTSIERYWLCPLYSFNCDCENIDLEEGIKIQRIPSEFVSYLDRQYGHSLKTIPSTARWIASLPYPQNTYKGNNREEAMRIEFEAHDKVTNLLVDFITALRIYQKGRVVVGLLTFATLNNAEWSIGGSSIWPYVSSMDFFEEEPTYEFLQSDVPEVNKILQNIRQWRVSGILNIINVTLERFHSAYHGPIEDRIIDQMIAFESLYLGNEQELTYRLILRTAFLLSKRKDHRSKIFSNLKQAYNYRSRIVHGDNPPNRNELRPIVHKTEDYLRQSIRRFLMLLSQGHSLKEIRERLLDENIFSNGRLLASKE